MFKDTARIITFNGKTPKISDKAFIADNVVIIGDVIIEDYVNIWPNATIRGDIDKIHIKKNSNIQDNCIIHNEIGVPCIVGENCTIGHGVILHSATIGNNCLVGMGSIVLDKAEMKEYSMLGAGALLSGRTIIPEKQLWLGSPAKYFRDLKEEEIKFNVESCKRYVESAMKFFDYKLL